MRWHAARRRARRYSPEEEPPVAEEVAAAVVVSLELFFSPASLAVALGELAGGVTLEPRLSVL